MATSDTVIFTGLEYIDSTFFDKITEDTSSLTIDLQPDQYEDVDPDDSVIGVGPCPQAEVDVQQVLCGVDQGLVEEVVLCFDRPEDMCISMVIG